MIVPCIKELQDANEKVRKIHEEMYNETNSSGLIWGSDVCAEKECIYYRPCGSKYCSASRCLHNKESWDGCRIPYMDYCSTSTLENVPRFEEHKGKEHKKVVELIKVESRMPGSEVHLEAIPVISETANCYELRNGDFVYKKNGERRSSSGKNKIYGKITVRYYPPTDVDDLEDCPNCGKSIFFPFEVIKDVGSMFNPIAKVCPHCGHKIMIEVD